MLELRNHWADTSEEVFTAHALYEHISADIIIVGGGFTGCSAALEVAKSGAKVVLIEAYGIGHGGSGRNVGLVNAGLWLPPDYIVSRIGKKDGERLITSLSSAPQDVFNLVNSYQIQCNAVQNGTLHCAHSVSGFEDLIHRHSQWKALGAPVDLLGAQETQNLIGTTLYYGALWDHRAGTIQPLAYCRGLARAAVAQGAKIYEHSPILSVRKNQDLWQAITQHGSVTAPKILFCTNAYQDNIHQQPRAKTSIINYFQAITNIISDNQWANILAQGQGCWDTASIMTSLRRSVDKRLIIGAMGAPVGLGHSLHLNWAKRKLKSLFPWLVDVSLEAFWFGEIAMSHDYIPKIQRLGAQSYEIFGFSGRGIGPGTVLGTAMAKYLITGDEAYLPIPITQDYSDRFRAGKTLFFETASRAFHFATY